MRVIDMSEIKEYSLNRTDIIIEAIKSYVEKQEAQKLYDEFDTACKDLKEVLDDPKKADKLQTLDKLLDKL